MKRIIGNVIAIVLAVVNANTDVVSPDIVALSIALCNVIAAWVTKVADIKKEEENWNRTKMYERKIQELSDYKSNKIYD